MKSAASEGANRSRGIAIAVLGQLAVWRDGLAVVLPASRKARALPAYLALAPRPVSRSYLCELLWDVPNDPRRLGARFLPSTTVGASAMRPILDVERILVLASKLAIALPRCEVARDSRCCLQMFRFMIAGREFQLEQPMNVEARHTEIIEMAKSRGRVLVDELVREFGVSAQTVRKDLNDICDRGLLKRSHGGAIFPSGIENMEYEARRRIAAAEKDAIGTAAAALVPNNSSLFINIGTTTEAVSQALLNHTGLMIITNNINVANRMRIYPTLEVVIAGGIVRGSDGGIVGEAAVDFIKQFKVDYAVIGTSAIDEDGALLDFDYREVKVAQAIIANARHVILVSDSTKFERTAPVRIAHLSQVDTFITDRCPLPSIRRVCAESDVTLIETNG